MHYLIGRDLDADGRYEFIQDMEHMILTKDPYRALQITDYDLEYIDMAYLNECGFYALEADRFKVSLLEALLFRPRVRGFRPLIPPPPPPRRRRHGLFGIGFGRPHAPRPPMSPGRHKGPRPSPGRHFGGGLFGRPKAGPGGFGGHSRGPGGRGGRGPGGRGPGR